MPSLSLSLIHFYIPCHALALTYCHSVTHSLTLTLSLSLLDSGEVRCRQLQQRCEELEAQLKQKEEENAELLRDLEQKNAMISVLENTIKEREKKYLEELKLKSHKLALLSGELEQRASTIAYLTSQLHATKRRLLAGGGGSAEACSPATGATSGAASAPPPPSPSYRPTPPPAKDRQPETPRRRMKKSLSQPLHPELTEVYRLDGRLVLGGPLDAMPDPTPFLRPGRDSPELLRERPAVIPPIASDRGGGASPRHSPARDRQHRAHVGVAHRISHATRPPALPPQQQEVETLAVEQLNQEKVVRKSSGADRTV